MSEKQLAVNVNTGARPIAETIRQLLDNGFATIRADIQNPDGFIIDELFSFYGSEVTKSVKTYLLTHANIPVVLNWPREGLSIPQVCIVTATEEEDPNLDFIGDRGSFLGTGFFSQGLDANGDVVLVGTGPIIQREQRGYGESVTLMIFVRSEDPTQCVYLSNIVRLLVFMNKTALIRHLDFHNLTIGVADVAHSAELFPEFAYTRQITLKGNTFFDYNLPQRVVAALDFSLLVRPAIISIESVALPTAIAVPYSK